MKLNELLSSIAREYSIVIAILVLTIIFTLFNQRFIRLYNILTILQNASLLAIISAGLTLVVIIDEFDLSFAPLCSLAACMAVNVVQAPVPNFLAVVTPLAIGLTVGFLNGTLVSFFRMSSFIATLGTATIITGLSYFVSGGKTIVVVGGLPAWFNFLGQESFYRISYLVPIMILVAAICAFMVRYTHFGRNMYGIGGNKEACLVAGVNIRKTQLLVFVFCGLISGLTGFLLASRLGGGHPLAGDKYLLLGFAAVFIGMTNRGGIPNVLGTALGAILLTLLENGLTLARVDYTLQYVINGVILVLFVSFAYSIRYRLMKKGLAY
jgi:ribose transport system permease protein